MLTGGAFLLGGPEVALPVFVGSVAGVWITPDYDLNKNLPASPMTRIPLVKTLWGGMWWPYQRIVGHRSFFSHFPVVGTSIRILYLAAWLFFFLWVASAFFSTPSANEVLDILLSPFAVVVYITWGALDVVHFLLDL